MKACSNFMAIVMYPKDETKSLCSSKLLEYMQCISTTWIEQNSNVKFLLEDNKIGRRLLTMWLFCHLHFHFHLRQQDQFY